MDFFRVVTKEDRKGVVEVRPDFIVGRSKDLMIRGKSFYAVYDEEAGMWATSEYAVQRIVDKEVIAVGEKLKANGTPHVLKTMESYDTGVWDKFQKFCKTLIDNAHDLDRKVTFANTKVKKGDYVSKRLPYALAPGDISNYEEMVSLLYSPEERAKFEWAIGSIIAGDSRKIEKFLVFYGDPGAGKGTVLKLILTLFEGYTTTFVAKELVSGNNAFAMEVFRKNPIVAVQHDGDLSRIEDNSRLNMIVSHEDTTMNEKFKSQYDTAIDSFLFMGTNKPVRISDAKSGLLRRLIDVHPSGKTHSIDRYLELKAGMQFELGAIANHCLEVYRTMGKNAYKLYTPVSMMQKTDVFYNYIEAHYDIFYEQDNTTLNQSWKLWKEYREESELEYKLPMHKFREELKNYFESFQSRATVNGIQTRNVYQGFKIKPFKTPVSSDKKTFALVLDSSESILDDLYSDQPAQYANKNGSPKLYWDDSERLIKGVLQQPKPSQIVSTTLSDLDTSRLHFVKVPENHIVIDFDLTDEAGEKSREKNLEAAALWKPTYAEFSKSGSGVHLHYIWEGDVSLIDPAYSEGIEIKVYTGNGSLRRKVSMCNRLPISTLDSGIPLKEKKVLQKRTIQSEQGIRNLIQRNLNKEIWPGTKPSIDFINKILEDAHSEGMVYDVSDLQGDVIAFANNSTNKQIECLRIVNQMKWKSEEVPENESLKDVDPEDERVVIFDVEIFPNLFIICWKYKDSPTVVRMINPSAHEVEALFRLKLAGFNNLEYDNHMIWAAALGYTQEQLYNLSCKLTSNDKAVSKAAKFARAYNVSYCDIYDFATVKQRLKKWQIDLGIHHLEWDQPWDQPVPEELWEKAADYCENDVRSTETVLDHLKDDFSVRQILADLSGLTVNNSNRQHATKIIFGEERRPQKEFVYTDLSTEFPGYKFDPYAPPKEKSTYRGEIVGEGGYVYAEEGMYENVALLDVASMHPTSIIQMDVFGPYTEKFKRLYDARLAIKHALERWKEVAKLENEWKSWKQEPEDHLELYHLYLDEIEETNKTALKFCSEATKLLPGIGITKENAKSLSDALKLVLNSVYGFTAATFDNPFKDPRNIDNIVAKRGALFMVELKRFIQEHGFIVAHIKTDSVKIPDANEHIIQAVMEFGRKYGYEFEHEKTFGKLCLVNDAVYIAKVDNGKGDSYWTATGAQFQEPYVFKTLFSKEPLKFEDLCQTKMVASGATMYLKFGEEMHHVGRTGQFVPVTSEFPGGELVRVKDDKQGAISGTKGYSWTEAEAIRMQKGDVLDRLFFEEIGQAEDGTGSVQDIIDMSYYEKLAKKAVETIEKYGTFEEFAK